MQSKWSLLPQTLANGLKLAMIIAITSIGLSLIFGTTGLSNFAHGEMVTFGAFAAFVMNSDLGLHLIPAALVGDRRHRPPGRCVREGRLGTAAAPIDQSHLDDDRVDRPRAGDALHVPVPVRWRPERIRAVHAAARPDLDRTDRPAAAHHSHHRRLGAGHRRASPCSCSRRVSARRYVPCPTTPTSRRRAGSTPTE